MTCPQRFCDEDVRWYEFLKNYAGVIEDGSLSCNEKADTLKLISGVRFTKGKPTADAYIPFSFSWEIALQDGRTLSVNVSAAAPNGREMVFHGVQLQERGSVG
jgi:hypothetical protein